MESAAIILSALLRDSIYLLQYSQRPYVRLTYNTIHYLPKHTGIRPKGTAYFHSHSQGSYCQFL